jgi:hypothetical protein
MPQTAQGKSDQKITKQKQKRFSDSTDTRAPYIFQTPF